jgi:MarR family 2-MHQ and catechol resistance regulon transcriptional repressor
MWVQIFMEKVKAPEAIHTWVVLLKARQAITSFLLPSILEKGLGNSDFRVLSVLLDQGPLPVNTIGPKVDLNPGSVSVAVDRLYKKGLVGRVESESDRRVRTVSLTPKGRTMFVPLFKMHTSLLKRVFDELSPHEQNHLEELLKKVGRRAEKLAGMAESKRS